MSKVLVNTTLRVKHGADLRMRHRDMPAALYQEMTRMLTIPNPKFEEAVKAGRSTHEIGPYIFLFDSQGEEVVLPRGLIVWLTTKCKQMDIPLTFTDCRRTLAPVKFNSSINLRDYQSDAIKSLTHFTTGGLVAGCGAGKTETMLNLIEVIGQPTLWVTHTAELLEQTKERAVLRLGLDPSEIGIIAKGQCKPGPRLTIALIQTLRRADIHSIKNLFGMVIVDEGHHCAADSYQIVGQFPAKYRYWCTATPNRPDGKSLIIKALAGPVRHTVPAEQLPTITPTLRIIETAYMGYLNSYDYTGMISACIQDDKRNALIVNVIARECRGHFSLVLSDRIEHLETLHGALTRALPDLNIRLLTGKKMKMKERKILMEEAVAKKVDIILATQLAREGLDLPHLDRLFLVLSKKSGNAIQQEVGRIMRPCEGKQDAVVFDFCDPNNPVFFSQFQKRCRAYYMIGVKTQKGR